MREALYRGKSIHSGEWVYGVPVPIEINTYMTDRIEMVSHHSYDELDYYNLYSEDEEVDPKTIGQYIGLKDKDGTLIFEGDFLESPIKPLSTRMGVRIFITDIRECHLMGLYENEYKIIGNIYDNPELLDEYYGKESKIK